MNNYFKNLKNCKIEDLLQVGVVDVEDNIAEFTTFHDFLFIDFGKFLLKFESIDQYSKLSVKFVDNIDFDFEIEEDMIPSKNSILELVLEDTMFDNRVKFINVFGKESENNELICKALSIHLLKGQEIFIDPTYFFGLNIGGERQRKLWYENSPVLDHICSQINISVPT